jgi:hypothetical protein
VVNLFALRSTYPALLSKAADPVGPENDVAIITAVKTSDLVIAAWGVHGPLHGRDHEVQEMIANVKNLHCLGTTKGGHPLHPLHQPKRLSLCLISAIFSIGRLTNAERTYILTLAV